MRLITIEQARSQVKGDAADDAMLQVYGNGAERHAEQFLNRRLFADASELSGAVSDAPAALEAAQAAYEAAIEAANDMEEPARSAARIAACRERADALTAAEETYRGMVATDDVKDGILLILAALYRDRELAQIPSGAYALLWPYRCGLGV